jgi:renalase
METSLAGRTIAIIGAGISGLSVAYTLRTLKHLNVLLLEKSRGVSGRATTRRKDNFAFDHGANYFYS